MRAKVFDALSVLPLSLLYIIQRAKATGAVRVTGNRSVRAGSTALHMAARAGAYEAVSCLLANYANYMMADEAGWTAMHVAAFFDQVAVVRLLARKHAELVDLPSKDPYAYGCKL